MPYARANPSTQQTNTNLIAAVSGKMVRVKNIYMSSDTALTVSLENSTAHSVLWRQYVGSRGGSQPSDIHFLSAWGEGIDYSTSGAGNVFLMVEYEYLGKG